MATINLTWDVSNMAPTDDIDETEIWRIPGDVTSNYNPDATTGDIDASEAAQFVADAQSTLITNSAGAPLTVTSFSDTNVLNPGSGVTYGVFSKNAVGYGPGSIRHITGF